MGSNVTHRDGVHCDGGKIYVKGKSGFLSHACRIYATARISQFLVSPNNKVSNIQRNHFHQIIILTFSDFVSQRVAHVVEAGARF